MISSPLRLLLMFPTLAALVVVGGSLSACSSNQPSSLGPTLADLSPATVPVESQPVPEVSMAEIEEHYRNALEVAIDPAIRQRIQLRLADIEMARSETRQVEATEQQQFFDEAIALYQQLLEGEHSDTSSGQGDEASDAPFPRERLLYQLAKAYALDGRLEESIATLDTLVREYSDSDYAPEAHFRRAELAFSEKNYDRAEALYEHVVSAGQTPFYSNALYMHGWSLFKQQNYERSLQSFTQVLDDLLIEGIAIEQMADSRQNLLGDTLRVMGIAFSYLDGADTIAALYEPHQRYYQHLLYQQLGNLYLEKRRYRDSAETFLRYTELFPDTDQAPLMSVRAINVYEEGGFPSLIRPAKEEFVRKYGPNSRFWELRGLVAQEPLLPHLHQYLEELASYYHATAQDMQQDDADSTEVRDTFLTAADYYRQFIETFPMDDAVSDTAFLMAEAYQEGGALVEALNAYETVAYYYMDPDQGADAGYAAILTLNALINTTREEGDAADILATWQEHKVRSAQEFAENYQGDPRAPRVLANVAEELFQRDELRRALAIAGNVIDWEPTPQADLLKTAWLVRSHSLFDLGLYAAAEDAYRVTLERLPADDGDRSHVIERIAATMYRQAESELASGEKLAAAERLLQIREVAPNSEIALKSQYDAANHLMDLEQWERAEQVLVDFRERYSGHELVSTLPPKFAVIYQELEEWEAAANALVTMVENEEDPEAQRQSLYLAAELYERAGNIAQAIVHYRQYAHTYGEPFDLATEARYKMVQLYEQTGEPLKRNYWLKKLIDAHETAVDGQGSTDRAHYLAAFAARELAEIDYNAFLAIKLNLPLKENLQRKKQAMQKTLQSYRQVLDYGVGEFATEANNRIGMVYAQLSRDLMESERPDGLNALELEQYELLLEEQAFPFEEKAIEIHATNAKRSWDGIYDEWVQDSFETLARLLPARYGKEEERQEVSSAIY